MIADVPEKVVDTSYFDDLHIEAQLLLQRFTRELVAHGIRFDPNLKMKSGNGLLVYYDLNQKTISLSLPNPATPVGALQLALYRPLLACATNAETARFIRLMLPRLVAHEVGHHLRHEYGVFTNNLWHEEQVANIFATAATRTIYSTEERQELARYLRRSLAALATVQQDEQSHANSYHSLSVAWESTGRIKPGSAKTLNLMCGLLGRSPEELLLGAGTVAAKFMADLENRDHIVDALNAEYTRDLAQYCRLQFGWMLVDLEYGGTSYLDQFKREHLQQVPRRGAQIVQPPGDVGVRALYAASRQLAGIHEVASKYFYRRYRSVLLKMLANSAAAHSAAIGTEAIALLELHDEEDPESLQYAALLAPQELQPLFPGSINAGAMTVKAESLPAAADQLIWKCAAQGDSGSEAVRLLDRLAWIERSTTLRSMPADLQLELSNAFDQIILAPGDFLIRRGSRDQDVFLVISGQLQVEIPDGTAGRVVAKLHPGELLGDLAFLTDEPRTADVRATTPAKCAVIPADTLRRLGFTHPAFILRLGQMIARRYR